MTLRRGGIGASLTLALLAPVGPLLAGEAHPQKKPPAFEDFPIQKTFQGKPAPLALSKRDRMFRTRLRIASHGAPNFAGHLTLTAWGCGTACLSGAAIDAATGKVHWLPGSICCWEPAEAEPIEYRSDSALLILRGMIDEKGVNGTHYYRFDHGRLIHLITVPQLKEPQP